MRELIVGDSIKWMRDHTDHGGIVTSLPDYDEVDMTYDEWYFWFGNAVRTCLHMLPDHASAVFYQTDRKLDGRIISKSHMVIDTAITSGYRVLWHKIALRRDVDKVDLYRPGYTHMIAVSKKGTAGKSTPDVFNRGETLYKNGMGMIAAQLAIEFVGRSTSRIVDPFCGRGTVPVVAESMGYHGTGIDIDPEQIEYAKKMQILKGFE